ncbi:hypothetical protein [Streptomyces zhihengii]
MLQTCRRHPSAAPFLATCSGCAQELYDIEQANRARAEAERAATVTNYDCYGSLWGHDTVAKARSDIEEARESGHTIDEWNVTDRAGQPLRIVRTTDPTSTFLGGIDIAVIPA